MLEKHLAFLKKQCIRIKKPGENLYKHKPCNDDRAHIKDFIKGIKIPKVIKQEAEELIKPLSQSEIGGFINS